MGFKSLVLGVVAVWVTSVIPGALAAEPPAEGGRLPEFTLKAPSSEPHLAYLGLVAGGGPFKVTDIRADVLLIQIFSMYCPHCQREAPAVNAMYETIEKDPGWKAKVKLIGIGAGNSDFEVAHFQKTYDVPFPLFPDADFAVHRLLGEVRTPYFIGVRMLPGGGHEVFFSRLGGSEKAETLIKEMLERSGVR